MNSYNENNINYEDNIRLPDKVKREKLIEDYSNDFEESDEELKQAINLSKNEHKKQEELNKKFEEEIINSFHKLIEERKKIFSSLKIELIRLSKYDNEIKEIYEILEPIFESYCMQLIELIELDTITYNKIFNVLSTIRIDKDSIKMLKTIIINKIL
jgi:hypothetical protein